MVTHAGVAPGPVARGPRQALVLPVLPGVGAHLPGSAVMQPARMAPNRGSTPSASTEQLTQCRTCSFSFILVLVLVPHELH